MKTISRESYAVTIYIAGSEDDIKRECALWCYEVGRCVTVTSTEFIYTGGRESGVEIGLVNYPRFPDSRPHLWSLAENLAERLIKAVGQHSALVQDAEDVSWITRRGP